MDLSPRWVGHLDQRSFEKRLFRATRTELRQGAFKLEVNILQSAKDPQHIFKNSQYFGSLINEICMNNLSRNC